MIDQIRIIDQKVLISLNDYFSQYANYLLNHIFGEYIIYSLPIILIIVWFWDKKSKKPAIRSLFSAILAWPIMANIIGHIIDRPRPFEAGGIKELLFHRPTYSFPSDHTTTLFAIAFSFWLSGYKKLSYAIFTLGIIISFFRVALGIHYPSDIIGGIIIGIFAAYLIYLFDKPLNIVYNFIIKIAQFLRLA